MEQGVGIGACSVHSTHRPGIAVLPGTVHPLRGITCVFLKADSSESEPAGLHLSTHRGAFCCYKAFFSPSGVLDRGLGLWRVAANRRRVAGLSLRWPLLVATPLQRTDRGGRLSVGCSQTKNRTAGPYVARRSPEPRDSPGKAFVPFAFFFFFPFSLFPGFFEHLLVPR